jgi:predicted anti-sigma-YlaC factor YlaD
MDCYYFRDNILAFAEKDLPSPAMSEMDRHLMECTECSLLYAEFSHVAKYLEEEKAVETRPYVETRIWEGMNSRLERKRINPMNWLVRNLQPAFISIAVISAIAIGILIGVKGEHQFTTSQLTDEQIESMRSDLNVPDFMDEENTSIN